MATTSALEAAMAEATASHAPVARKLHTTQAEYAAARADLDARARAGQTVQGRNSKGHFTRGVKVFTAGVAPVAPVVVRKVEKVATVAQVAVRVDRERSAPASAPSFAIAAE
ncbi:hypothetical protein [Caulobacter sp. FWC2]|uniref:hypothetical protein n=1 Tax=Caulobacter sp. FWC2 TaxID=69664 RepID=UPI000C14A4A6|nr:hypothetical protein [Caulobacter sp. FWC2]PIB91260.1 hypothetical protein CSW62_06535 [Caulobacter sp. FWC2]